MFGHSRGLSRNGTLGLGGFEKSTLGLRKMRECTALLDHAGRSWMGFSGWAVTNHL